MRHLVGFLCASALVGTLPQSEEKKKHERRTRRALPIGVPIAVAVVVVMVMGSPSPCRSTSPAGRCASVVLGG